MKELVFSFYEQILLIFLPSQASTTLLSRSFTQFPAHSHISRQAFTTLLSRSFSMRRINCKADVCQHQTAENENYLSLMQHVFFIYSAHGGCSLVPTVQWGCTVMSAVNIKVLHVLMIINKWDIFFFLKPSNYFTDIFLLTTELLLHFFTCSLHGAVTNFKYLFRWMRQKNLDLSAGVLFFFIYLFF